MAEVNLDRYLTATLTAAAARRWGELRTREIDRWVFLHKGTKRDIGGQRSRSFRPGSLSDPSACR
jgi:hypothetical protein